MDQEFQIEKEIQIDEAQEGQMVSEFHKEINKLKLEHDQQVKNLSQDNYKKTPVSNSLKIKFNVLIRFFIKLGQIRGRKKTDLIQTFFDNFAFKDDRNPQYTYTMIRLIIPFQDRERGVYKLQEKAIAKLFHQALGLPEVEYQRMANYKHASLQPYGAPVGDFPSVVHSVVEGFCRKDSIITIAEVDGLLDELVQAQDTKAQVTVITKILQRCTADELLWIIRIILKDLKVGMKYEKVLEYFHPDAAEYYNATSSLREVCREFEDRNHSLRNVLRLFHPIKPMLAAKKTPNDVRSLLENKQFLIETKYDGERIQCHFTPEQMRFFTRNANDYTHIYGAKMMDVIRQCVNAHSAILDGEIVVVDKVSGQQVQFGLNKPVAREQESEEGDYRLCYKVFDVLYVKGFKGEECNMMNLKLSVRRQVLKKILKPIPCHLELVNVIESSSFEDIITEFDNAIIRNEEGIIIKQLDTEYHPNERSSKWVKLKGDYLEGVTDTFDCLVIGGYYGTDSHRVERFDNLDRITHFLVGIQQKIDKNTPLNSLIIPFAKVGTGFSSTELSSIRNKLRPHFVIRDGRQKPQYLPGNWNPGAQDRPDCYIDSPANSIIYEVKAAELIRSNTFPSDYTLRFPRCLKIRWDKDWYDVMSMQDLNQMINDTQYTKNLKKKNTTQNESGGSNAGSDDELPENNQRPTKHNKVRKQPGRRMNENGIVRVMKEFQGIDYSSINRESNLLQNCEFYIINVQESFDKSYLELLIAQNGGTLVQNFIVSSVTHVLASALDFRVQTVIDNFPVTVIKPEWVLECLRRKIIVSLAPRFILYAQKLIWEQNKKYYDDYGDSYFEDVDENCLRDIFARMDVQNVDPKLREKYAKKLINTKQTNFNGRSFFFWKYSHQIDDDELETIKVRMKVRDAIIEEKLTKNVDYIVLFPNQTSIQERQVLHFLESNPHVNTTKIEKLQEMLDQY